MANAVAEDQFLKVHRAQDGAVWYIEGAKSPMRSALGLHDFPDGPEAGRSARIRMLGTKENAPLIARFYDFKRQRRIASIAVASPRLGKTDVERGDPKLILSRMRSLAQPASLGGYHEVTPLDYTAYLFSAFSQLNLSTRDRVERLLVSHPLWKYLSFVPHLDKVKTASVIGMILDPRWFIDWDMSDDELDPGSYIRVPRRDARRLKLFLGLDPGTMAGVRAGKDVGHVDRARDVLAAWKTTPLPPVETVTDPRYFLWRRWCRYDSSAVADLRVSQLFVDFVRQAWLDAIYMASARPDSGYKMDGMFAPDHFFKPDEAAAFREHAR